MGTFASTLSGIASAKKFTLLLLSFFFAAAVFFATANSAGAAEVQHSCGANQVCFYEHKLFGGSSRKVTILGAPVCVSAGFLTNQVSSVVNNTGYLIRYFQNANCGGPCWFDDGPYSFRENLPQNYWQGAYECWDDTVNDSMDSALIYY